MTNAANAALGGVRGSGVMIAGPRCRLEEIGGHRSGVGHRPPVNRDFAA